MTAFSHEFQVLKLWEVWITTFLPFLPDLEWLYSRCIFFFFFFLQEVSYPCIELACSKPNPPDIVLLVWDQFAKLN